LRAKGHAESPAVLAAFAAVPRHLFVPDVSVEHAYRDEAIPTKRLDDGEVVSSSSQPAIMARMLEQLDVRRGQRVLEIGAGTGYNAALLAHLVSAGGAVTTLDIDDDIVAAARAHLATASVSGVDVVCADGWNGHGEGAPYDRIVLTVGAHDIAPAWRAQLTPGGRLLLPFTLAAIQGSIVFEERDGALESLSIRGCQFMRLRGPAAVALHPVPVGPAPAARVWPRGDHRVDGASVHALMRLPGDERAIDFPVAACDLHDALVLWLALHEPTSAWFTAHGEAAAATGFVPALFEGDGTRASFGLFEANGIALLFRTETDERREYVRLAVRAHGDPTVGERLGAAVQAWDHAGRPGLARLRVRAYPIDCLYRPQPGETMFMRPCTRLVLDWRA
jgi:protein-L-isoaspartate(D-aspartate) O-methyltransferase